MLWKRRAASGLALLAAGIAGGALAQAVEPVSVKPVPEIAVVTLSDEARALRDHLLADGDALSPIGVVYQTHDFEPVWDQDRSDALLAALDRAGDHGLPAARYDAASLRSLPPGPAREMALTEVFLTYARDVNSGLIEPRSADRNIVVSPKRPDPAALLEGLILAPEADGYLAALAPAHPDYAALQAEKLRLEQMVADEIWGPPVPADRVLRLGDEAPVVAAVRARLGLRTGVDLGDGEVFDEELDEAIRDFQRSVALTDDGVIGPKTFAALNTQPEDKLRKVLVNLERQRWLNYDRGRRHIIVNLPDFSASLIDQGETTLHTKVVIGKNRHQTQEFNDTMTHMVVNPTWHVPRSIATEEFLPRLRRNPHALGRSMRIMTRNGTVINPALVNFNQFTARNFPFIVKQRPGPRNALGRVKFMFPNEFNIYLHDTPAKQLFGRDVRAYSHGCVRVEKPFELAEALLAPQSDDPRGLFQTTLDRGRERQIDLDAPVPIYLTYQTAFVDAEGTVQFRGDIYGRDARVFEALEAAGLRLAEVEG